MVDPLDPTGVLGVAVDEDQAVQHGGTAVSEADQDVGAHPHAETDAVGDAVVVQYVFNLKWMAVLFKKKLVRLAGSYTTLTCSDKSSMVGYWKLSGRSSAPFSWPGAVIW